MDADRLPPRGGREWDGVERDHAPEDLAAGTAAAARTAIGPRMAGGARAGVLPAAGFAVVDDDSAGSETGGYAGSGTGGYAAEAPGRPARRGRSAAAGRRPGHRRARQLLMVAVGLAVVLAVVAAGLVTGVLGGNGPAHVLVTPNQISLYVRRPQLEQQMNASQLQRQVIAKSAGQASHVVSAVYENNAGVANGKTPQMILFIGGNLSGVSASGFIASFTQHSAGAFQTSPGPLGGSAACVNAQASVPGSVALCTWADNDTFGVVASPTMDARMLASQMRVIRPGVEHLAK